MSKFSSEQYFQLIELLKNVTASYGNANNPTSELCELYLDELEESLDVDNFFWVVNLKEQRIERSAGVYKYLGYQDNPKKNSNILTLFDIYYMVHEDMQEIIQAQRKKALPYLSEQFKGKIKPLSNDYIYKVIVCFVKKNGESILVKQKSTCFQLDEEGNMLSYLSYHEVIRDYNNEAPSVEIIIDKKRNSVLEKLVEFESAEFIELPFTPRELDILKVIASYEETRTELNEAILNNQQIADLLKEKLGIKITANTVHKHKTNFLGKAKQKYDIPFSKDRDLAIFLRKYKLI